MIKSFGQWNNNNATFLNESVVSSLIQKALKLSKSEADNVLKSGFKGISSLTSKLFGASVDDIAKIEKNLADIIMAQKDPLIQSISRKARKALEKRSDEVVKKYLTAYHSGDISKIEAARKAGAEHLKKIIDIKKARKYVDEIKAKTEGLPTRKLRNQFGDSVKQAEDAIDDAAKTGDMSRLDDARRFVDEPSKFFKDAGTARASASSSARRSASAIFKAGTEPGADLGDDVLNGLSSKGKSGFKKTVEDAMRSEGRRIVSDLSKGKQTGGIWKRIKTGIKWMFILAATIYGGGVALEFLKRSEEEKAEESINNSLEQITEDFAKNGITLTEIQMNKASFAETFQIFFAGTKGDLPIDDANELETMFKAGSTMTDFFAKTAQLCFEYPKKYFTENESAMKSNSKFYGFIHALQEKIKVSEIVKAVSDANGNASDAIQETFYENGEPVSLDEYGYVSYTNPNIKILLGQNEPVPIDDLIDESKEFLEVFSTFKRKISNGFIETSIIDVLEENGTITQEEFEERSKRIEDDLKKQLSEKESVFVAMTGLILAYNANENPFSSFYGFSDTDLYSTTESISELIDNQYDLQQYNQLRRIYLTLSSEFSSIYDDLGKERSLYGVMEYSNFGFIMRSLMTMYALEKVCKMILSGKEEDYSDSFTKEEIEEYQKILFQIQKKEGLTPTVTVNGSLDPETENAISAYQEKIGLPKTGKPGEKSLVKLKEYLTSIITSQND
jgi:peptidoglycan hydrolase-like protein with peptidoglycan-binding domain